MSTQNIWANQWNINDAVTDDGTNALAEILLVPQGPTRFSLTPVYDGTQLTCYRVEYNAGEMTQCWDPPVYMFPRGADPVATPLSMSLPSLPLPTWVPAAPNESPPERTGYHEIASAVVTECDGDPTALCLQGDIHVNGVPEAVTFYQVQGVLSDSPFLVINVESRTSEVTTRESGIAHGNT